MHNCTSLRRSPRRHNREAKVIPLRRKIMTVQSPVAKSDKVKDMTIDISGSWWYPVIETLALSRPAQEPLSGEYDLIRRIIMALHIALGGTSDNNDDDLALVHRYQHVTRIAQETLSGCDRKKNGDKTPRLVLAASVVCIGSSLERHEIVQTKEQHLDMQSNLLRLTVTILRQVLTNPKLFWNERYSTMLHSLVQLSLKMNPPKTYVMEQQFIDVLVQLKDHNTLDETHSFELLYILAKFTSIYPTMYSDSTVAICSEALTIVLPRCCSSASSSFSSSNQDRQTFELHLMLAKALEKTRKWSCARSTLRTLVRRWKAQPSLLTWSSSMRLEAEFQLAQNMIRSHPVRHAHEVVPMLERLQHECTRLQNTQRGMHIWAYLSYVCSEVGVTPEELEKSREARRAYVNHLDPAVASDFHRCSICIMDMDMDDLETQLIMCGHAFHRECIRRWGQRQRNQGHIRSCPNCRTLLRFEKE